MASTKRTIAASAQRRLENGDQTRRQVVATTHRRLPQRSYVHAQSRQVLSLSLSLSLSSLQQHKARTPRSDKNVVRCSLLPRLRNDLYCVEWDVKLYYTIPYHARCCSLNRRSIQLYVYATVVIDAKSQDQIKSNQNPKPLTLNYQRCTIKMQASKIHS